MKQCSFKNEQNTLYIIPSPIGNIGDVSNRIIEVINECEVIACEDTRVTGGLLNKLGIKKKLVVFADHNSRSMIDNVKDMLASGNVGLMSDAGTPLISDPGYDLVNEVAQDYNVVSIPGPVAFTTALVASGIPANKIYFVGFLPNKSAQRQKQLEALIEEEATLIFYESCHRIRKMVDDIKNIFNNRKITIAREVTKMHEEYIRTNTTDVNTEDILEKGEFVVILEGKTKEKKQKVNKYKNIL